MLLLPGGVIFTIFLWQLAPSWVLSSNRPPSYPGFHIIPATTCRGGNGRLLSGYMQSPEVCLELCNGQLSSTCGGFIVRDDGVCAVYSVECGQKADPDWTFYLRSVTTNHKPNEDEYFGKDDTSYSSSDSDEENDVGEDFDTPTEDVVISAPTRASIYNPPTNNARPPANHRPNSVAIYTFESFDTLSGKHCSGGEGGHLMNSHYADSRTCADICLAEPKCGGFNVKLADGSCSMRLPGCRLHNAPTRYTFYRKSSHRSEIPSFNINRPAAYFDLMATRYEPQFFAAEETWCHSGRGHILGGYKAYIDDCADTCKLAGPRCAGFNVRPADGICFAFEAGCMEEYSTEWVFFQNRQAWKIKEPTEVIRTGAASIDRMLDRTDRYPTFPSFNRLIHMKCAGGLSSSVFEEKMKSPQDCAVACLNNPACYGFSLRSFDNYCIGRTRGCTLERNDEFVFFVKNTLRDH